MLAEFTGWLKVMSLKQNITVSGAGVPERALQQFRQQEELREPGPTEYGRRPWERAAGSGEQHFNPFLNIMSLDNFQYASIWSNVVEHKLMFIWPCKSWLTLSPILENEAWYSPNIYCYSTCPPNLANKSSSTCPSKLDKKSLSTCLSTYLTTLADKSLSICPSLPIYLST